MGIRALSTVHQLGQETVLDTENYGYKSFTQTKTDRYGHESTVQLVR